VVLPFLLCPPLLARRSAGEGEIIFKKSTPCVPLLYQRRGRKKEEGLAPSFGKAQDRLSRYALPCRVRGEKKEEGLAPLLNTLRVIVTLTLPSPIKGERDKERGCFTVAWKTSPD
jgi:hypothetical protein